MKVEENGRVTCPDCIIEDGEGAEKRAFVFYNQEYDNYSAYCYKHCTLIKNPFKKGEEPVITKKTYEEKQEQSLQVKELPNVDREIRGIPAKMYSNWGVKMAFSEYDGKTPYAIYYPYGSTTELKGWKQRNLLVKSFSSVGDTKGAMPFGWVKAMKAGARRLYITEGEQDAIALDYALMLVNNKNPKYKGAKNAIISLPDGAGSAGKTMKLIHDEGAWKEIILVFDNDEAGKAAVKAVQKVNRDVLVATMPTGCKDANDAVKKKLYKELFSAVMWDAKKPPIQGVVHVSEVIDRVIEKPVMGLSYPWDSVTELTYGQRFGECCGIGGGVGIGKTLLAHEIAAHNIVVHGLPVFTILLEEDNGSTLRNIAGKIDSIPYHKPDSEYDNDKFLETVHSLEGKLMMWKDDGDQYQRFEIDEIIKAIRFNVAEYGVKFVAIDNATRLVDHLGAGEANEFLNKYASELEGLSTELDIHIDLFSHLNKPSKGNVHENGGKVFADQFTGSRGMMRSFPLMMGFERNKSLSSADSCKSSIVILKNRKYGGEGLVKTQYYKDTGRLIENLWSGSNILDSFGE